jgi:hypothetical protein
MSDEQKGFTPKTEEEIKSEVIADLRGESEEIDLDANADLISRITQRRLKDEEFKASVHAQKIERTERAKKLEEEIASLKANSANNAPLDETKLKEKLKELREEETLEELEMPDEIKEKVKMLAKINNVSVKKASEDPYIKSVLKEAEEKKRSEDASITNNNKARAKIDISKMKPEDFDLTTPEGQQGWDAWKKAKGLIK